MKWVKITKLALGLVVGAWAAGMVYLWGTKPVIRGPVVEARIVRFGGNDSRWQTNWITVVASTKDGVTGQGGISAKQLYKLGCKVGDRVDAQMIGSSLKVDPRSCVKSKPGR